MNPEKLQPEIEQSLECGNNVNLNFIFARHGEKSGEGKESILTEKGQEQAAELGRLIETPEDGVKVYYSDKIRAQQTAEILMNEIAISQAQTKKIEELKREGFKSARIHRQEKLLGTGVLDEKLIKTRFGGIAKFIETDEQDIPQDITSPRELASAIAKLIMRYMRVSPRLPSDTEVTLVNITHLPTLMSFLKNTIGQEIEQNPINPKGENFVEKIGGPINPAERITLKVHRENPENLKITIQLRGKEFPIDLETLKSLADYQRAKTKQ